MHVYLHFKKVRILFPKVSIHKLRGKNNLQITAGEMQIGELQFTLVMLIRDAARRYALTLKEQQSVITQIEEPVDPPTIHYATCKSFLCRTAQR